LHPYFKVEHRDEIGLLRLTSEDGTNRLSRVCVLALTEVLGELARNAQPLIFCGNEKFFSVGADLHEISALSGSDAYEFARMGQALMNAVAYFPAPVYAAVEGHCMGGGLDLALACHYRIVSPNAVFGHRGAALGLMTGWGGTQRLPRLIGKVKTLQMFVAAEKIPATQALQIGLVDAIAEDPLGEARIRVQKLHHDTHR
jgi:enoyl-CoA hydratase/carnithine racemase